MTGWRHEENMSTTSLENQQDSDEKITAETNLYCVAWTVHITLAVPQGKGPDKSKLQLPGTFEKAAVKKRDSSSSLIRPQSGCQIQCKLLPGSTETTRVDLVMYGPVVKLCHKDECKMVRTWQEGDQTWFGWVHSFKIAVNRDSLLQLVSQRVRLQIWNSKDKRWPQIQHEKQKTFSLVEDDTVDVNECVETMVNKIRGLFEKKSKTKQKQFQSKSDLDSETDKNALNQKLEADLCDYDDIRRTGSVSVEINPIPLLIGAKMNDHFLVRCAGVTEALVSISLDKPLMSEQLQAELNPLIITILSATSLPSSPVPFHVLQEECLPVYCQYTFHNLKPHKTKCHKQSTDIYFRDMNVIMTGLMSSAEIQEFLSGPPLEIQVHDRDRKWDREPEDPATMDNFNTHGVVRLDLSELLRGKKSLRSHLPILCCRPLDRDNTWQKRRKPLPQGHYVENNSRLKIKVDIAHPLNIRTADGRVESCGGPFGRIIYFFTSDNFSMVTKLKSEILQINATAFQLHSGSLESIAGLLSNHRIDFKHDSNKSVDFISGFHVLDERTHICVIEGLRDKAVKRLWEVCPMKLSKNKREQVIVHYNSSLGFFKRLYDSLDLFLNPIQLCESLASIMRKPRMYIRGSIPPDCFQALSRLSQLCQVRLLDEAVQSDLFPSADMILSMSKVFGVWVLPTDHSAEADATGDSAGDTTGGDTRDAAGDAPAGDTGDDNRHTLIQLARVKRFPALTTSNTEYIKCRHSQQSHQPRNYIQENVKRVREQSERLPKKGAGFFLHVDIPADQPVHNYSIQTFNFSRRAKELLQKRMAKMPGRRFTYSQRYLSATVEPAPEPDTTINPTPWVTSFRTTGHPKRPHQSRMDELRRKSLGPSAKGPTPRCLVAAAPSQTVT